MRPSIVMLRTGCPSGCRWCWSSVRSASRSPCSGTAAGLALDAARERLRQRVRLLVRGLGARRHRLLAVRLRASAAVAEREDVVVPGHLQRLVDHQLAQPVDLEAVELGEPRRPLDARGPYDQVGREKIAAAGVDAFGGDLADLLAGVDLDFSASSSRVVATCTRSGSAGSTLGAASISRTSMLLSVSNPRRP